MMVQPHEIEQLRGKCALVDGAFDPLHDGHVAYMKAARDWLDYQHQHVPLVCNVASDEYLRSKHVPFLTAYKRADLLCGLRYIRHVTIGPTVDAIRTFQPRHYIKGKNWEGRLPAELYTLCRELGVSIKHVETGLDDVSSTALLRTWQHETTWRAVADLEDFARHQPAPKPWKPVVDYSLEARRIAEGPLPELINRYLIDCEDADVLDWGCGPGTLVQLLREVVQPMVRVTGYDPNEPRFSNVPVSGQIWDLVICREVFEHVPLREWPALVGAITRRAARFVYLTTRFHPNPLHPLDVTADGHREIDPTEITFATKELLHLLFALHGCAKRYDLEECMDWKRDGNTLVFER